MNKSAVSGFTLAELMVVVGIIGILASIAVPTFAKYKYKVRISEATTNLGAIFKGEAARFQLGQSWGGSQGVAGTIGLGSQLVNGCRGPTDGAMLRVPTDKPVAWDFGQNPECKALGFDTSGPTYFAYWVFSGAAITNNIPASGLVYHNMAFHDLDGDTDYACMSEYIGHKDQDLYRMGRYTWGDPDFFGVQIAAWTGNPPGL